MEEEKASSSMSELAVSNPTTTTTSQNRRPGHPILPGEIRQLFSLPESIIYYIAMHPSNAEVYKKLIRTCKYFYNRNPILVVYGLDFGMYVPASEHESDYFVDRWEVSFKKRDSQPTCFWPTDIDTVPCKFWVIDTSILITPWCENTQTVAASIIPKIYRSDSSYIELTGQTLTLDELLFLGSNATHLRFDNVKITENNDGKTDVLFEKVIERFPKLKEIFWRIYDEHQNKCISKNTATELIKLPNFANITQFELDSSYETFDAKVLFQYLKTCNKNMEVDMSYGNVSDQFKQKLDEIVDEIISTQTFTYKPPNISYAFFDQNKLNQIREIHYRYLNTRF